MHHILILERIELNHFLFVSTLVGYLACHYLLLLLLLLIFLLLSSYLLQDLGWVKAFSNNRSSTSVDTLSCGCRLVPSCRGIAHWHYVEIILLILALRTFWLWVKCDVMLMWVLAQRSDYKRRRAWYGLLLLLLHLLIWVILQMMIRLRGPCCCLIDCVMLGLR